MICEDVDKLMEELRELFREQYTKNELLLALAARINCFQHLKGTDLQAGISEFIVTRAEDDCEILIHDEEITQIWSK